MTQLWLRLSFLFNLLLWLSLGSWGRFWNLFRYLWFLPLEYPRFCLGIIVTFWLFIRKYHLCCFFLFTCKFIPYKCEQSPFAGFLLWFRCYSWLSFGFDFCFWLFYLDCFGFLLYMFGFLIIFNLLANTLNNSYYGIFFEMCLAFFDFINIKTIDDLQEINESNSLLWNDLLLTRFFVFC